jgi:hypothetical protein
VLSITDYIKWLARLKSTPDNEWTNIWLCVDTFKVVTRILPNNVFFLDKVTLIYFYEADKLIL